MLRNGLQTTVFLGVELEKNHWLLGLLTVVNSMYASSAQVFLSLSDVFPVRAYRVKINHWPFFACGCSCGKVIKIAVTDNPLSTECRKCVIPYILFNVLKC